MDADLTSHHIEGYALQGGVFFTLPLITEHGSVFDGCLWQGGCTGGVDVRGMFDFILSLYPWEKYLIDERTERLEVRMYDSAEGPDETVVRKLATLVGGRLRAGQRVLVHCQAGLNRSSLIVATLLVQEVGMLPEDAIAEIRSRRSEACLCNEAFEEFVRGLR